MARFPGRSPEPCGGEEVRRAAVGDPSSNLEAAKAVKQPKKAKERFDEAFAQIGQ